MNLENIKNSKTFCIYPFIHLATLTDGSIPPCCIGSGTSANLNNMSIKEAWNSDELKSIRLALLKDQPVKNCYQCYNDEAAGVSSHRQRSNNDYMNTSKDEIELALSSVEPDGSISVDPFTLDIRAGNVCNLKCVMCRPNESSKWLSDAKSIATITNSLELKADWSHKASINTKDFSWVDQEAFWEEFKLLVPNLKEIIFGGGEPFVSKSINNLISYMVETGHSKHIKIRFHTNGTQIPVNFWPMIDNFKEIQLMFSIDGYKEQNYYTRYPANWGEILNNLILADNSKAKSKILCSIHSLNILDIDKLYSWFLDYPFKQINRSSIVFGRVYNPSYLNPQGLPVHIKNQITNKINTFIEKYSSQRPNHFDGLKSNLNWIMNTHESNLDTLKEYVNNLDQVRGTSFVNTFPELSKLLDE